MEIAKFLLTTFIFTIVGFFLFSLLRNTILPKIKINKWVVLLIAFLIMIGSYGLRVNPRSFVGMYIIPTVYVMFFLWFLDLSGLFSKFEKKGNEYYKNKNSKNDVIKPKAKPNRINKEK